MTTSIEETNPVVPKFDPPTVPEKILNHERRTRNDSNYALENPLSETSSNKSAEPTGPLPIKKERRRRVDPTTYEKQYTEEEVEFMNAMQHFKTQSGHHHPTFDEVLRVATNLGYRKIHPEEA